MRNIICLILCIALVCLCSCNKNRGTQKDADYNKSLVISEIMTDNEATVLSKKNKPVQWIEIANISKSEKSLDGLQLMACEGDSVVTDSASYCDLPKHKLAAGERVVIYAGKKKKKDKDKDDDDDEKGNKNDDDNKKADKAKGEKRLKADIKFAKKAGTVMLLNKNGNILSQIRYDNMICGESMQRLENDTIYTMSCQPTPGFANNAEGVVAFMKTTNGVHKDALQIWEMKAHSASTEQWVELKNTSTKEINLADYCLTNKTKSLDKFRLPDAKLAPGAFYVVHTGGKKKAKTHAGWANFKLSDNNAVLLTKNGKIVDAMSGNGTRIGGSRGRIAGKDGLFYFDVPSPKAENAQSGFVCSALAPTIVQKGGAYKEKQMTIEIDAHGGKVHFTTDGTTPTIASPLYSKPIEISKSTTVRCLNEGDSLSMASDVQTTTYLLGEEHNLAVLNITINPDDLWNPSTGIYVEGNHPVKIFKIIHKDKRKDETNMNANYLQDWVKPVHAELFDGKEGFSIDCGLKVFGAGSRKLPKKSLALKFDPAYGPSSLEYDFFNDGKPIELEDIVLRSGSSDQAGIMARDEYFTSLMQEESPTLLTQNFRPIVLFVNCEYWGVFYFREKIDRHFIGRKLGVSADSVSVMRAQIGQEGDVSELKYIYNYVSTQDMRSEKAYKYIEDHVCLESMIDQKLGEMFSCNDDIYNVREVRAYDKNGDNKWYWILYDLDNAFIVSKPMGFYMKADWTFGVGTQPTHTCNLLVDKLMVNPKFRALFLERLSHHMNKTFAPKHVTEKFDKMIGDIRPEMKRECAKWGVMRYDTWEGHVKDFRDKLPGRSKVVLDDVKQLIHITPAECKKYNL